MGVCVIHSAGNKRLLKTVNCTIQGVSINNGFERAMFYCLSESRLLDVLWSPCALQFFRSKYSAPSCTSFNSCADYFFFRAFCPYILKWKFPLLYACRANRKFVAFGKYVSRISPPWFIQKLSNGIKRRVANPSSLTH